MSILAQPRDLAELAEIDPRVPAGTGERFSGYGVMGLPFSSGHILAFRRFPASSLGYGYSSVWHRSPEGTWTFWSDVAPEASCYGFFGAAVDETASLPISIRWTGPRAMRVTVGDGVVDWELTMRATPVTVAANAASGILPERMWRDRRVLEVVGKVAGPLLGVGRVTLTGRSPNGQVFLTNPLQIWLVATSSAVVRGTSAGEPKPLPAQAMLGDFAIPQRGVFAIGRSSFELSDPHRQPSTVDCLGTSGWPPTGRGAPRGSRPPAAASPTPRRAPPTLCAPDENPDGPGSSALPESRGPRPAGVPPLRSARGAY